MNKLNNCHMLRKHPHACSSTNCKHSHLNLLVSYINTDKLENIILPIFLLINLFLKILMK